jgi:hypothetical protein
MKALMPSNQQQSKHRARHLSSLSHSHQEDTAIKQQTAAMVDNSSGEDTRKKRDNEQVHYDHGEKPKKIQKGDNNMNTDKEKICGGGGGNFDNDDDDSNAAILPSPPKCRATERSTSTHSSASSAGNVVDETSHNASPRKLQKKEPHLAASAAAMPLLLAAPTMAKHATATSKSSKREIWDLESAMLYLVRLNKMSEAIGGESKDDDEADVAAAVSHKVTASSSASTLEESLIPKNQEFLTPEKDAWTTFGMAHSGDATTIANWYRKLQQEKEEEAAKRQQDEEEEKPEIEIKQAVPEAADQEEKDEIHPGEPFTHQLPMLEHWLAEGLGDEVTCPSVYGLLAYVQTSNDNMGTARDDEKPRVGDKNGATKHGHDDQKPKATNSNNENNCTTSGSPLQSRMAAVVLLTLAWTSNERHLRVEWMAIDSKHLSASIAQTVQQKLWMRISALSVMTACPVIAVDEMLLVECTGNETISGKDENETLAKRRRYCQALSE